MVRTDSNFQYKDFEKTKSYHTDFGRVNFNYIIRRSHTLYGKKSGIMSIREFASIKGYNKTIAATFITTAKVFCY